MEKKRHISYSELCDWLECPHYRHLRHDLGLEKFRGSPYSCVGTALHSICEKILGNRTFGNVEIPESILKESFDSTFRMELLKLFDTEKTINESFQLSKKTVLELREQACSLIPSVLPALEQHITKPFTVFSTEHKLYEPIPGYTKFFMGFIDLVLIDEDKNVYILDYKTCSSGWSKSKKVDPITLTQLALYRHFFASKFNIDKERIKCYFALLKRTAKKNRVDIFEAEMSPEIETKSFQYLTDCLKDIETEEKNKEYIKN